MVKLITWQHDANHGAGLNRLAYRNHRTGQSCDCLPSPT